MALSISKKYLSNLCRLISLSRHIQQKPILVSSSQGQLCRSFFPAIGIFKQPILLKPNCDFCQHDAPTLSKSSLGLGYSTSSHSPEERQQPLPSEEEQEDKLYKWIELKVKGHDDAVLDSYTKFVNLAANELDITVDSIAKPTRHIRKLTLLKSRHVYKKHRVQYELRTYYRDIKLKHLTGSTSSVFLEYIERNLPEGLAMQVKKCSLQRLPEHLGSRPADIDDIEDPSSSSSSSSDSDNEENRAPDSR